ncbi:MAG TPA: glycosyltransferase family 1 protein [Candidatus Methylomirabilis sp.]|nr:glycosyltransferase family 1 protein [Candidatus Methylomirabilis sp.]
MHVGLEATPLRTPQLGGVWRYTDGLTRALARVASPHHYSLLFLNSVKPWARVAPPRIESPTMRLVEVRAVSNFFFTYFPLAARRHGRATVESFLGAVDLFHSVNAAVLPQRLGLRVVTVHDLTCLRFPGFHPWVRRTLFQLGIRRAVRQADAIIVPSAATRHDLVARFPAAGGRVHVVAYASGEEFAPMRAADAAEVIARYGLSHRGYFLFVGNIEPRKNLRALVEAYNRMRAGGRSAPALAIAGGSGWKNRAIHRAVATSPFASDIRLLGRVPDSALPPLVNGALAFVYPSLSEGFGLPPLEAMACGTPVITSNRSSLPEVVGDAALLVDPDDRAGLADAMALLMTDGGLRDELRERGLARAGCFSWDKTARMTVEVYESAARQRRGDLDPARPARTIGDVSPRAEQRRGASDRARSSNRDG